jgi:hypothetical protein
LRTLPTKHVALIAVPKVPRAARHTEPSWPLVTRHAAGRLVMQVRHSGKFMFRHRPKSCPVSVESKLVPKHTAAGFDGIKALRAP